MSQLKAGLCVADVTPPPGVTMAGYSSRDHGAESVETPLSVTALVLEGQGHFAAVALTDIIGATADLTTAVREQVGRETDIPPEAVNVCGSHTHWGPALNASGYLPEHLRKLVLPEYVDCLTRTISGALIAAWRERTEAFAGWGTGLADGISFNRRPVTTEGKVAMNLTLPPEQASAASREGLRLRDAWRVGGHKGPRLSPPLEAVQGLRAGVTDPYIPLLKLLLPDGSPLCGVISFACHPVVGGEDNFYAISPDYPHEARQAFEGVIGAPLGFALGCAGDQVPTWRGGDSRVRVGRSLGAAAAREWLNIRDCRGDVPVRTARQEITIPVKALPDVADAQEALDACEDPESSAAAYQRHLLALATRYQDKPGIETEMWAIRVGDWAAVTFPGEVLAEIGLQVKQRSPFPVTGIMTVSYDALGYISTADAHVEGGYEPGWSAPGPEAERVVVDAAVELLTCLV